MGFFNNIKNAVASGIDSVQSEIGKLRNKSFMEGVVAGAVLIACADGHIDPEEKSRLLDFIEASEDLKCFSANDIAESFEGLAKKISVQPDAGKAEAFRLLGKLRDNSDQARMAVRAVISIAKSDGNFEESEKEMAKQICLELGLDPKDFSI